MKPFLADLHLHTALSPCASDDLTPPAIVATALAKGLALVAVCDHNSAGNAAAVQQAASGVLAVIAGIEITTAEEAHVVGLFPDAASAEAAGRLVLETLPLRRREDETRFGSQLLLDAEGGERGREPRMLAAASALSLVSAVALIKRFGGLAVAAHADRPRFSVTSQLGLFPADAGFDAIELSALGRNLPRAANFFSLGLPVITASDSHSLDEIGSAWCVATAEAATFDELSLALRGVGGRGVALA